MTPGQRALQEAIDLRMEEVAQEHGLGLITLDWVFITAATTLDQHHTFYHRETRGPGEVAVHAELGLLAWGQLRVAGAITGGMQQ